MKRIKDKCLNSKFQVLTMTFKNAKWQNILILSCALFVLVLIFEIIPDYIALFSKVESLIERGSSISEGEKNKLMLNSVVRRNKDLKNQIGSFVSNYNENTDISATMDILYKKANQCHMTIATIRPSKVMQKNNLWYQPMEIDFITNYQNTFNFVKFIEKSQKVIIVKQLNIVSSQKNKNFLDVKANIEVYLNL